MSQIDTFDDLIAFYFKYYRFVKKWTFIVATSDDDNIDLYAGLEEIPGIGEKLFTLFAKGKVSIINKRIFKNGILCKDPRVCTLKCISFDTQTASYFERYSRNKTVPNKGFSNALQLLEDKRFCNDCIPYLMENIMFGNAKFESVEQTIFAYEMMHGVYAGKEKECKKSAKKLVSVLIKRYKKGASFEKYLYMRIYLALLKMCSIQWKYKNWTTARKMDELLGFMSNRLGGLLCPELNLAKMYFDRSTSCGFFGKIHPQNEKVLNKLKNMVWDIMHLRYMDYSSMYFDYRKADTLIPYFYTYDKHLQEIRSCYTLKALATNAKIHAVIPIYAFDDSVFELVKEHLTFEKHRERMCVAGNIEKLVEECERELVAMLVKS